MSTCNIQCICLQTAVDKKNASKHGFASLEPLRTPLLEPHTACVPGFISGKPVSCQI